MKYMIRDLYFLKRAAIILADSSFKGVVVIKNVYHCFR